MNSILGMTLAELPATFERYEAAISDIEDQLRVTGKTLEQALKEQAAQPIYYEQRKAEIKAVVRFLEAKVDEERGVLTRKYIEQSSIRLTERAMNSYIDHEKSFQQINNLLIEAKQLLDTYEAITEAYSKRGYALRDVTTARVHDIHNYIL